MKALLQDRADTDAVAVLLKYIQTNLWSNIAIYFAHSIPRMVTAGFL